MSFRKSFQCPHPIIMIFLITLSSCGTEQINTTNTATQINDSKPPIPTKTNIVVSNTDQFATGTLFYKTPKPEPKTTTDTSIYSSLPQCQDKSVPEGTLLLTVSGINALKIGCQSTDSFCPYHLKEIFKSDNYILDATWSPNGNTILFAADIDAPPMRPEVGGMYTEIRLFTISPNGGVPMAISSRGGFVSNIDSCKGVDRILYAKSEDISKIYMVDSLGYGSSFSHNGKSVGQPVCSPLGQDIAFETDDGIYVKHIGNSVHNLVSTNAFGHVAWSPDQKFIAFSYSTSKSIEGTCIALTNIDSNDPPSVLEPCPIPGTGIYPVWSEDGKQIITIDLTDWNTPSKIILLDAPINASSPLQFPDSPRTITSIYSMTQSSVWIGSDHFLVINEALLPDPVTVQIIDINNYCLAQEIEIPRGSSDPDWLPS